MHVLVFTPHFLPGFKGGGPIKSVAMLLERLGPEITATVITADRDLGDEKPYPGLSDRAVTLNNCVVYYSNTHSARSWTKLIRYVRGRSHYDLIYFNSLWAPWSTLAPLALLYAKVLRRAPILIAPRGELHPGALAISSSKKALMLRVLKKTLPTLATSWHATNAAEADQVNQTFSTHRIVVQDNFASAPAEMSLRESQDIPRWVYLSRVTPKKGLDRALLALRNVGSPVQFDIYGPIEDANFWAECISLIEKLPSHVAANYRGTVEPSTIAATFAQYDAFLFPTAGENYGHVISESLAAGCPVICTDQTPWSSTIRQCHGLALTARDDWAAALDSLATINAAERYANRKDTRRLYAAEVGASKADLLFARALSESYDVVHVEASK